MSSLLMTNTSLFNNHAPPTPSPPSLRVMAVNLAIIQLREGVIPGNIGINLCYIRYMQTSEQSQGHYRGTEEVTGH